MTNDKNEDALTESVLRQDPKLGESLQVLQDWTRKSIDSELFATAFLFGSAVNEAGLRFDSKTSDFDVILRIEWDDVSPWERVCHLEKLQEAKIELEYLLLRSLGRTQADQPIVSLLPLSNLEFRYGIHKGGNIEIFTSTKAIELKSNTLHSNLITLDNLESIANPTKKTLEFIQKCRSTHLFVGANGSGGLIIPDHSDPLPKELMRNFAVAVADEFEFSEETTSLTKGLNLIDSYFAGHTATKNSFSKWLEVKRGARGKVDEKISLEHYLLVVEAIFEQIRNRAHPKALAQLHTETKPQASNTNTSEYLLTANIIVTTSNHLGGKVSDKRKAVASARANIFAQVDEPFNILFEEPEGSIELMQRSPDELSVQEHKQQVKLFMRREFIRQRETRLNQGIWLILYYGKTLFPSSGTQLEALLAHSIDSWIEHWFTGIVNIGGLWDAWHEYYNSPFGFSFSAEGGTRGDRYSHTLWVSEFSSKELSRSFVPELVSRYLYLTKEQGIDIDGKKRDQLFSLGCWRYGLR